VRTVSSNLSEQVVQIQKILGADLPEACEVEIRVLDLGLRGTEDGHWERDGKRIASPSAKATFQVRGGRMVKQQENLAHLGLIYS
jgi:hypothetical protein